MIFRHVIFLALLSLMSAFSAAQQPAQKSQMIAPLYVDPVCPVSPFAMVKPPNATKELRISYYPAAKDAALKDPQSLTLYIGFNFPQMSNNSANIPFEKKDDHWDVIVPVEKFRASYAILYVKDDKAGAIDDHGGKLWDILFCSANGERNLNSLMRQAESYTGVSWPLGIHRERDYAKAVSILESHIAGNPNPQSSMLYENLWSYKALRDGDDAKAWAKIADEIDQYIQSHLSEPNRLYVVGNYIARSENKLPAAFVDRVVTQMDALNKNSRLRAQLAYSRAIHQPDPKRRIAAIDDFIKSYPDAIEVVFALESKFYTVTGEKDLPAAEATFAAIFKAREAHKAELYPDFNDQMLYLTLADLYIEKGVKLDEALKLADRASDVLKPEAREPGVSIPQKVVDSVEAQIAMTKAKAYLRLKQPKQATVEAQKAVDKRKSAQTYYVLAQAMAAAKEKQKALDAYFEALLLPSNSDLKFATELQDYYVKQGFGDEAHFQAELERRKQERFRSAAYKPALTDKSAPAFEFSSLTGEKFTASSLKGKTAIVNFWSPG